MYLSTLRSYIEAIGGKLELTVKLPARPTIRLHGLGDVGVNRSDPLRTVAGGRKRADAQ
ncbi:hypothetical protein [Rhizobium leguminosarum]|uniref:hypothetical protein n=1 Tax=Rhizobium leguminosarum TaxID=384 RepID=UPI001FE099B5